MQQLIYEPYGNIKVYLASILATLTNININDILNKSCFNESTKKSTGDITFNMNMLRAFPISPINTDQLAQDLMKQVSSNNDILNAFQNKQYLHFEIDKKIIMQNIIHNVINLKDKYGCSNIGNGKTIVVEYSSPNIAKPIHLGHLRSTILGNFIKNIHLTLGYNVVGINYLGDWGKQFGLLILGLDKYMDNEKLKNDPIHHLNDVYVGINKDAANDPNIHEAARNIFAKLEQGDQELLSKWNYLRDVSIKNLEKLYTRMNIKFDVYSGESMQSDEMINQEKYLNEKNLLIEDNGTLLIDLSQYKLEKALIKKYNGSSLYITRDIAAAYTRYQTYKFDKMFYVVATQQNHHFKQLFKILELLGYDWAKNCVHISYGLVQEIDPKTNKLITMSTRKGKAIFLDDILNESQKIMADMMENKDLDIADILGMSAIYIQDFSAARCKNYVYDAEKMFSFKGYTGPYLQYSHARISNIIKKCGCELDFNADLSLINEVEGINLALHIGKYPLTIFNASQDIEPYILVNYLFELSHHISICYQTLKVKNIDPSVAKARLLLFWSAQITLSNGIKLLGLLPLDQM